MEKKTVEQEEIAYYCNDEYVWSCFKGRENKNEAYMPSGRSVTHAEFKDEMKKTYEDMLRLEKAVWDKMSEVPTISRPVVQCGEDGEHGEDQVAHGHEFLVSNPALYGFSKNQINNAIRIRVQCFVETPHLSRSSQTSGNTTSIHHENIYIARPTIYGKRSVWELLRNPPPSVTKWEK